MAKAKVSAPVGADTVESGMLDDGLIDVFTLGDAGTHKDIYINGVATSIVCGIVMRVSPEAAEQMRQCNLI